MIRLRLWSILAIVALSLWGCGGGKRTSLTRAQVLSLLQRGLSVSKTAPRPDGANARAARSTRRNVHRPTRQTQEFDRDHQWFDETYQLWAAQLLDGGTDTYYFEDEALTIPAGSDISQEDTEHLFGIRRHLEILAGPHRGDVLDSLYFLHEGGGGQEDTTGKTVDGDFEWHATWPEGGLVTYTERWTLRDSSWFTFALGPSADGSHQVEMNTSAGIRALWDFEPDLSGAGSITGPGAGLPATMIWNEVGDGEIVWSDGAKEPYNVWS